MYNVKNIKFNGDNMYITIDNEEYVFSLAELSPALLNEG